MKENKKLEKGFLLEDRHFPFFAWSFGMVRKYGGLSCLDIGDAAIDNGGSAIGLLKALKF